MSKEFVVVAPQDSLAHIASLFESRKIHHVLVMENAVLLGIISDRDVLRSVHPNTFSSIASNTELNALNKTANQIMTSKPVVININKAIIVAAEMMLDKGISALPVADSNGNVVGIVSLRGIVKYFVERTREKKPGKE